MMSDTLIQPVRLGQERRFPIALSRTIGSIRELYESAKQARWNPMRDVDWAALDLSGYDARTLEAARWVWSRRAWLEYPRLSDTPAMLIRFCLEPDRESDVKYFLTVRNTEEAWQIESYHALAQALGGYFERPARLADEPLFNQYRHVRALSADQSLDVYFAIHSALEAELEARLFDAYLQNTRNPVVAALLGHCLQAKQRHASFGWLYLEERAPGWDAATRRAVGQGIDRYWAQVELAGFHCAALSADQTSIAALDLCADAGLGAIHGEDEVAILLQSADAARQRLAGLGIEMADSRQGLSARALPGAL